MKVKAATKVGVIHTANKPRQADVDFITLIRREILDALTNKSREIDSSLAKEQLSFRNGGVYGGDGGLSPGTRYEYYQ